MVVDIAALLLVLAPVGSAIGAYLVRKHAALEAARMFFSGRRCALCDAAIPVPRVGTHAPALCSPDGITIEWTELSADQLRERMGTDSPVCWNCHVAEEFRRRFPDLVVDRPAH